jgi:hypothetical protein
VNRRLWQEPAAVFFKFKKKEDTDMTDPARPTGKPGTTGQKYRALQNISFGKDRPAVGPGDIFQLDDAAQAKDLLAKGYISTNVAPKAPAPGTAGPASGSGQQGGQQGGEPAGAAATRGNDADDKNAGVIK